MLACSAVLVPTHRRICAQWVLEGHEQRARIEMQLAFMEKDCLMRYLARFKWLKEEACRNLKGELQEFEHEAVPL